jgi:16S rRNA G966 N2-methylase RsmD
VPLKSIPTGKFLLIKTGQSFSVNITSGGICLNISKETSEFIRIHQNDDVCNLALQAAKYPDIDFPFAIRQIAGRQIAASKIPSWHAIENIVYPAHISLEQCSSEWTARYKSSVFHGKNLVDLTGGLGIDSAFLSARFEKITYVERQEELCKIATFNFNQLSLKNIEVHCSEAESFIRHMNPVDCIYLDPSRRDKEGKKTVLPSDCEPDIIFLKDQLLSKAHSIWIKFSPMLDIAASLQQLPETSEIHVASLENECKELLFKMEADKKTDEPAIHCVNLKKNGKDEYFSFKRSGEINCDSNYIHAPQDFIYEPNSSILKAGAFKSITQFYPVGKLHPNSHLYTSDKYIPDFQGRIFRILFTSPLNKKNIQKSLSGINRANISVRNFPLSVQEIRKKLNLKDGGKIYLFATTLFNDEKVIIGCEKV